MTATLLLLAALGQEESQHRVFRGEAMGSSLEIQVLGPDPALLDRAIAEARAEIDRLDRMMTDWKETGALMEVNREAGRKAVQVPAEFLFIVKRALQVSELTNGAFDITWAGAGRLWKWWEPDPAVPSPEAVKAALENVGWRNVVIDEKASTLTLAKPGVRIGLGAIVPGYAGDLAMRKIRALGVKDALVNLSGDVLAAGTKRGQPWKIGLEHPRKPGETFALMPASDQAVSTSSDSKRFFIRDGRRYGHIIDPRTGVPADRCQSATVTASTLAYADALATAVFVLGPEEGMALLEKLPGVEGVIVAADGKVTVSSGLSRERLGVRP